MSCEIQSQQTVVEFITETMKTVELPLEFIFLKFAIVGIL